MSFASALNILHRALPYHLALAKYDLIHITRDSFELCPHFAAPPIVLELAAPCFSMGASSCCDRLGSEVPGPANPSQYERLKRNPLLA